MTQDDLWFNSDEEFMWGPSSHVVSPRVVGEFCDWEEAAPACWLSCCPGTKILFDPSVHTLCLSIGTGVEGSGQVLLNSESLCQFFCERRREPGVPVRNYPFRESEPRQQMRQVFLGDAGTIDCLRAGDEFSCFRAPLVYDRQDRIIPL